MVNVELSPLCSPEFRPGKPSEKAQALSEWLNGVLTTYVGGAASCLAMVAVVVHSRWLMRWVCSVSLGRAGVLRPQDLVIEEGGLVWVIYVDLMCLEYDGSLADACLSATLGALDNRTSAGYRWAVVAGD